MRRDLNRSLLSLLLKQFIDYKYFYLGAFLCLYGTHEIGSRLPFLAKELADNMFLKEKEQNIAIFFWLALGIIFFRTSSRLLFFYPARVMQKKLRVELVERLEGASPSRYGDVSSGQLFQTIQDDMDQLRALVGFALLQVGNVVIALLVLVPKLNAFHPDLLIALLPMLLTFILFTFIVGQSRGLYKKTQDAGGEVQNFLMESYKGKKTIKNFNAEGSFIDHFHKKSYEELYSFYLAGKNIAVSMPLIPLGVGISLIYGSSIIHEHGLEASSLILFSGFVFLFLEPMMFVSWIGVVFVRSSASWARIRALVRQLDRPSKKEQLLQEMNFREYENADLNFKLEFWGEVLSFEFEKNNKYVFIGKTGCGKSHLLTQLAEILKIQKYNISYVAQDPYLYNDTISKNIFLGQNILEEDKKMANELLTIFGLDILSNSFENLLEMEVGENGKRLSGGQAKRLALVRSLLSSADVLIWDDPFSSVDIILEKEIFQRLFSRSLFKNKTLILCSHRLTTIRFCDYVFYVEKDEGLIEAGLKDHVLGIGTKTHEYFKDQMV